MSAHIDVFLIDVKVNLDTNMFKVNLDTNMFKEICRQQSRRIVLPMPICPSEIINERGNPNRDAHPRFTLTRNTSI
jgi:hypothetical protein